MITDIRQKVRPPTIRAYLGDDEIVVDNFAGGGGASLPLDPDIAINHDPEAIAMHAANHPRTKHYIEDVWEVDPVEACAGRPVGLAWFSPTCTFFSKSRGGPLSEEAIKIRALPHVVIRWAAAVAPRIICFENVEEIAKWGPLHKQHTCGCSKEYALAHGRRNKKTKKLVPVCKKACAYLTPIKAREGQCWRTFVRQLERLGYKVEWRLLRASDYGAPTSRRRLFLVARRDGLPVVWPEPTHGPGRDRPHRGAHEIIDWSIVPTSIFDRDKPLVEKTLARLARGVWEFVVQSAKPFILPLNHGGVGRDDRRVHDIDEPMPTITAGCRGSHALAVPYLIHRSNGERKNKDGTMQLPRIYDVAKPIGTIVAEGEKHAVCAAFLAKHFSDRPTGGWGGGQPLDKPAGAVTTRDHHALVAANLVKFYGTSSAKDVAEPLDAVTAGGWKHALQTAHLMRYNGEGDAARLSVEDPLGTVTTKDRYALVSEKLATDWPPLEGERLRRARAVAALLRRFGYPVGDLVYVPVGGERYVVADLCMRMLVARELFNAQDFPPDYIIDPVYKGKPLTKTSQVRMCGNAVPPTMSRVIATAQLSARALPAAA